MLERENQEKTHTILRRMRIERGWTQIEVADAIGVTKLAVGRWERGERVPQRFYWGKLSEVFGKSAVELGLLPDPMTKISEALPALWNIPYPRNPFFTGRDDILYKLYSMFNDEQAIPFGQSCTLSGLGGSGKTQIAIEYAYRYVHDYTAVFWINAETAENVTSSISAIAHLLDFSEEVLHNPETIRATIVRWLAKQRNWLMIFDHVDDPVLIKEVMPSAHRGTLLFTSQRQAPGFTTQTLNVEPMTLEEGTRFLLYRIKPLQSTDDTLANLMSIDEASSQKIVSEMNGLPLALDQAASYIEATRCSFSDYLRLLQHAPLRLLEERSPYTDHPLSVSNTFIRAFKQIEQNNTLALELLIVCAILASEAIPEMLFIEGASQLGASFGTLLSDPFAFNAAIKVLLDYSLVQREAGTHTLTIHRLVQIVLKGYIPEATLRVWTMRVIAVISSLFPVEKGQADYEQMCKLLLPHALRCITAGEQWNDADEMRVRILLMNHVAAYLMHCTRFDEAEALYRQALVIGERALEPEDPLIVAARGGLAALYDGQGKRGDEPLL